MVACAATITVVSIGIIVVFVVRRVQIGDGVRRCNSIMQATAALLSVLILVLLVCLLIFRLLLTLLVL